MKIPKWQRRQKKRLMYRTIQRVRQVGSFFAYQNVSTSYVDWQRKWLVRILGLCGHQHRTKLQDLEGSAINFRLLQLAASLCSLHTANLFCTLCTSRLVTSLIMQMIMLGVLECSCCASTIHTDADIQTVTADGDCTMARWYNAKQSGSRYACMYTSLGDTGVSWGSTPGSMHCVLSSTCYLWLPERRCVEICQPVTCKPCKLCDAFILTDAGPNT